MPCLFIFGNFSPIKKQKPVTTTAPKVIRQAATCKGVNDSRLILTAKKEKPHIKPKKVNKDQLLVFLCSVSSLKNIF